MDTRTWGHRRHRASQPSNGEELKRGASKGGVRGLEGGSEERGEGVGREARDVGKESGL